MAITLFLFALGSSALGAPKQKNDSYAVFSVGGDGITIFPLRGEPIKIAVKLPKNASNIIASPDGGSIYWIESVFRLYGAPPHPSRLVRLDLHSLTSVDVPGVEEIDIGRMDIRNNYILLWGERVNQPGACGI